MHEEEDGVQGDLCPPRHSASDARGSHVQSLSPGEDKKIIFPSQEPEPEVKIKSEPVVRPDVEDPVDPHEEKEGTPMSLPPLSTVQDKKARAKSSSGHRYIFFQMRRGGAAF